MGLRVSFLKMKCLDSLTRSEDVLFQFQVILLKVLNYITEVMFEETQAEITIVGRMLSDLIKISEVKDGGSTLK
jgi:hypothetical protein